MRLYKKAAAVVGLGLMVATNTQAAPELGSSAQTVTAGYFQLHWSDRGDSNVTQDFILEESANTAFNDPVVLYRGPDTATLISGRPDGTYFYRIRYETDQDGWSNTVSVEVEHHPLFRALLYFGLGALVFLATLVVVVHGNRHHHDKGA